MTLRIPDPSIGDKILKLLGKKRGLIIPKEIPGKPGVSTYAHARKENFWKAFSRPKHSKLPDDVIDYEDVQEFFNEVRKS